MVAELWWRNLAGAGSVLAVVLTVVFGLPALDRAVPVDQALAEHRLLIADGVTVMPPGGAIIAKQIHSGPEGSVMFLVGPARYAITVSPFDGDLEAAFIRLRKKIQSMRGYQVTSPEIPTRTDSGLQGRGSTFAAPGRSGRYIAFVAPGKAIEVTISGSKGDLHQAFVNIDQSIASIAAGGDGQ